MRRIAWVVLVLVLGVGVVPAHSQRAEDADVKELLAALKKPDVRARRKAAETICERCKAGDGDFTGSVPALVEALKDKDPIVRGEAAEALGEIGPDARDALPALIALQKDKNKDVRKNAAEAIRKIEGKTVPKKD